MKKNKLCESCTSSLGYKLYLAQVTFLWWCLGPGMLHKVTQRIISEIPFIFKVFTNQKLSCIREEEKFFIAKNKFIARIGNKKNKNFIFKLTSHKITISKRFQTSLALNCSLTKVLLQFTNINFKTFSWNSLTVLQNINLDFREVYPLTAKSHEFS